MVTKFDIVPLGKVNNILQMKLAYRKYRAASGKVKYCNSKFKKMIAQ